MFRSEIEAANLLKESPLRKGFFQASNSRYLDFVFLCGKARSPGDNRDQISKLIIDKRSFLYSLYSEDVFPLFRKPNVDLLSLEEVLADISTAILIIVESMGSACELGAFSYLDKSVDKLWVVNDKIHMYDKSFIQTGPLQKIKDKAGEDHVFYEKFDHGSLVFSTKLVSTIEAFSRSSFQRFPFEANKEKTEYLIRDLSCLTYLLFEYVLRFGYLREATLPTIINHLIQNNDELPLRIQFSSGNSLFGEQAMEVLKSLPRLLEATKLFRKQENRNEEYYIINADEFDQRKENPENLTSLIFHADASRERKLRARMFRIKNLACKEGFQLWKTNP